LFRKIKLERPNERKRTAVTAAPIRAIPAKFRGGDCRGAAVREKKISGEATRERSCGKKLPPNPEASIPAANLERGGEHAA